MIYKHLKLQEIKERIEQQMAYPGTIKVTVIRETRITDIANDLMPLFK